MVIDEIDTELDGLETCNESGLEFGPEIGDRLLLIGVDWVENRTDLSRDCRCNLVPTARERFGFCEVKNKNGLIEN